MMHRGSAKGGGRAASRAQPSLLRVGLRYDLTRRHPECSNVRILKSALRFSCLTSLKPSMGRITASPFASPWWLSNPHLQTLWPLLLRPRRPQVRERVEFGDDDFLDLSCVKGTQGPLVLVLHNLVGFLDSHWGESWRPVAIATCSCTCGVSAVRPTGPPGATTPGPRKN